MSNEVMTVGHRADGFAVRRWLRLGAASAGVGAALWGMALVGPQLGTAVADDGASSSASAASGSDPSASSGGSASSAPKKSAATKTAGAAKATTRNAQRDAKGSSDAQGSAEPKSAKRPGKTATAKDDATGAVKEPETTDAVSAEIDRSEPPSQARGDTSGPETTTDVAPTPTAAQSVSIPPPSAAAAVTPVVPTAQSPWALQQSVNENPWQANVNASITAITANLQALFDGVPVPQLRDALNGALWTVRRTFFNLAPTLSQTVTIASGTGTVVGRVDATDPEGDEIQYRVVQGPRSGFVTLNVDGSYTYTAGAGFDGVDTFVISAADQGLHVNLLDPFRGPTTMSALANQGAITFGFRFLNELQAWPPNWQAALWDAANRASAYVMVTKAVRLIYDVDTSFVPGGFDSYATSALVSAAPGFHRTVVQQKLLTGIDANGDDVADGVINWNAALSYGLGNSVDPTRADAVTTAMGLVLNTMGWTSWMVGAGGNVGTAWSTFDQHVTTRDDRSPIREGSLTFDPAFDPYLTGYYGGLYFSGENAVAANGGLPVPLWTPSNFVPTRSVTSLDGNVYWGANRLVMNQVFVRGTGPRELSAIERAVLKDLGYTVIASPMFAPRTPS